MKWISSCYYYWIRKESFHQVNKKEVLNSVLKSFDYTVKNLLTKYRFSSFHFNKYTAEARKCKPASHDNTD